MATTKSTAKSPGLAGCIWASLPVIALAFAGAAIALSPALQTRSIAVSLTMGTIWLVVLVNLRGVKAAGLFAAIAIIGLLYMDPGNLGGDFNPSGQPLLVSAAALAPLTMFCSSRARRCRSRTSRASTSCRFRFARLLVDGGAQNLPVNTVRAMGADVGQLAHRGIAVGRRRHSDRTRLPRVRPSGGKSPELLHLRRQCLPLTTLP